MGRLIKNSIHRVRIEGYTSEGLGVARIDGLAVFVRAALAGETCEVQILKVLKNCAFARVVAVEEPSSHRREPDCPLYGRCGGCDFRHMDYEEELRAKRQRVQDALNRLGGLNVEVEEILGAEEPLHYRNKSQYPVSAQGSVGFYRSRSHDVVPVERCLIQHPAADDTAGAVRAWMECWGVSGYDESAGTGLVRHVYVRVNRRGESLCCLLVNGEKLPHEAELVEEVRSAVPATVGVVLGVNKRRGNVILGQSYRTLWGSAVLTDTMCGLIFQLSVPSFYQVNTPQAERLYDKALEFAALTREETALDLYCGIGTITLCLAGRAKRVIGAEIVPEAVEDARENARRNGVDNAEFFCGDASDVAERLREEGLRPDVICVDPPRKGLAADVVDTVAGMKPGRIVYVSCDPATLARDARRFKELGYPMARAASVDLFPGTAHVETVALLAPE
ncbi:23S rRNA (uracil(1939)-C(5))-methyltransferase RlmD [Oscillibacter sp. MSJ-2]|uniref:23S rRNA (Uracil(1939)-C(5))-methyltransferase RlmD n=1 Tax=Dysosmobacter acutus TaxID=2841504 RepID=A0ABS6FCD2_9FIRM|nr:23S rRNA (uracil(1939)-C(5))-methyltransferase RlmD [Dysosmobacter acutus]MBU5627949.1 23S rRNA (uracil(1939)-C(5))-methyltransferase RlmD [Dysosmobacter acutus]